MNANSESTLMAGTLDNMNNTGNNGNGPNKLGSVGNANQKPQQVESKSPPDSSLATNCLDKGNKRKSEGLNSSFNSINTISSEKSNKRKSEGLNNNSNFTRAQRIGLKKSLTQRRPNRNIINANIHNSMNNSMNSTLKNSLMSIESLTLDDIDSSGFDGGGKLGSAFEDSDTVMK